MTPSEGTSPVVSEEASSWESQLGLCIAALGSDSFHGRLVAALRTLADFDYSVVFGYRDKEKPACLGHTFSTRQRTVFVDDYLKGPYLLDPFFKACSGDTPPGLYRLQDLAPDRFYQSEYYRSYYVRTGLSEEICYILPLPSGVGAVISLMRSENSSRFTAREFRVLDRVAPIVISLAGIQWKNVASLFNSPAGESEPPDYHSLVERTVADLFSHRVTPREIQVIAQVLEGHSSEAIARSLGISVGTVRIHRRNIYAKLNISSQQELFGIFFNAVSRVHEPSPPGGL